jgi:thiamine pyrophosphate-dependent acetolactate synthase large subunit-like protein
MNGADVVAHALHEYVIDVAFGLPGAHNLALWPACEQAGVRIVGMRHEQSCAYAADGFARVTGKPAAALVTTGPGAANTIGAVGEAWASHSPIAIIATDIPLSLRRENTYRGVLHECTDQAALFAPVTKARSVLGDASEISDALLPVTTPPAGPVYVGIPHDLLSLPASASTRRHAASRNAAFELTYLFQALERSERPMLWVGGGARDAGDAIDALARRLGAPVVTTYRARGILPPDHPMLVPAPPHEPEVIELIARSDFALVIGSDLDQMNTMQWRLPLPPRRIAINTDPRDAVKNYAMDHVVVQDARVASNVAELVKTRAPWFGSMHALNLSIRTRLAAYANTSDAIDLLTNTESVLSPDVAVFADMCVAGYWLAGHLRVAHPRVLHYPMGWGTLGFALPAAIGASVAVPTVAFVGDGGALFALGELSAFRALNTPCVIVIVDDQGYGMLKHSGHATSANDLPPVDFVAVAHAFNIPATRVEGFGAEYAEALKYALASGAPRVIHVRCALQPPVSTTPYWPLKATS